MRDLLAEVERAEPVALAGALQAEGLRRFDQLLTGVEKYRHHPQHRTLPEAPVLWSQGTTRLLDYRQGVDPKAPRLLVIPSLVNRYYVLDLEAEQSFLRWCAAQGMAPFVVDWGSPGAEERGFDFTDYVAGRLEAALEAVKKEPGGPIFAIGYCMGGNLALALALRRQAEIAGLILLGDALGLPCGSQGALADAGRDRPQTSSPSSSSSVSCRSISCSASSAASTRSRSCASSRTSPAPIPRVPVRRSSSLWKTG